MSLYVSRVQKTFGAPYMIGREQWDKSTNALKERARTVARCSYDVHSSYPWSIFLTTQLRFLIVVASHLIGVFPQHSAIFLGRRLMCGRIGDAAGLLIEFRSTDYEKFKGKGQSRKGQNWTWSWTALTE